MSKIRLHGSSSGYTEIAPVAASSNNTVTLPSDGTLISHDGNGAIGVTSITVGTGVTIGDGKITCDGSALTSINAAQLVGVCTSGLTKTGGFGGGKILQVVQTVKTDVTSFTSNSSSTYADISGMSAAITPSSSSNKILVSFVINVSTSTSDRNNSIKLLRDSTAICVGTEGTSLNVTIADKTFANKYLMNFTHQFLDSPGDTSAHTYKLQWACEGSGGNQTYYLNRKGSGTGEGTASTITLMEVEV